MKKAIFLLIPALALAVTPVSAGHEDGKCTEEATVCITKMVEGMRSRGWVGIEWDEADGRPRITLVVDGSPAAAAGVRVGDLVTAVNGVPAGKERESFYAELKRSLVPGRTIALSVLRDGTPVELAVTLIPVPEQILAQWVGKHVIEHHVEPGAGAEAAASP